VPIYYEVTAITVAAGQHGKALSKLEPQLAGQSDLLGCWYSEIGALNRILILRKAPDAAASLERRQRILMTADPFGLGDLLRTMEMDTYAAFDFLPPVEAGAFGPIYEVRTYELKNGGLTPTLELWRKSVPGRAAVSPLLTAMISVTGAVIRFMHIWPYKTLEERARLRAKAIADRVWPPPGGPDFISTQQSDIYLPGPFSPLR
jgi:NIPSNAP